MNKKRSRILIGIFSFLAALAISEPAAVAQTVNITFVAGSSASVGGVSLSPYTLLVNGVNQTLICDDFSDEVVGGETWTADVYGVGSGFGAFPTVNFGSLPAGNAFDYTELGYLADLLLNPAADVKNYDQTALSIAIWSILEPNVITGPSSFEAINAPGEAGNIANALMDAASNAAGPNAAYYLNGLTIYQPEPGTQSPNSLGVPQQFLGFNVPEALSPVTLVFNLLALLTAVFLFRRRSLKNTWGTR